MSLLILRAHSDAGKLDSYNHTQPRGAFVGLQRYEMNSNMTFSDLKQLIEKKLNIDPRSVQIFSDQNQTKRIQAMDSAKLS